MPKSICLFFELLSLLMLFFPLIRNGNNIYSRGILPFFILYYLGSIPLLFNAYIVNSLDGFVLRLCVILPLLILYFGFLEDKKGFYSLLYRYSNIVCCFSAISLLFWLLGEVLVVINPTGFFYVDWGGLTKYGHNFFIHFHGQGLRNCGLFTEAPMYNIVLCTALCVELFLKKNIRKKRIILLVVTIYTTFSTTGQLILLIIFLIKFREKVIIMSTLKKMILFLFILIVVIAVGYFVYFIVVEKMAGYSYFVRYSKMMLEFKAWLDSPLFGHGHSFYTDGSSNSLTIILAEGGVYLFFLYLLGLIIIPVKYLGIIRAKGYFCLTMIYSLMLMITIVTYTHLTFVLVAMGLSFFIQKRQNRDVY